MALIDAYLRAKQAVDAVPDCIFDGNARCVTHTGGEWMSDTSCTRVDPKLREAVDSLKGLMRHMHLTVEVEG